MKIVGHQSFNEVREHVWKQPKQAAAWTYNGGNALGVSALRSVEGVSGVGRCLLVDHEGVCASGP